jgi:hydroxyacylglutathione hydrolase
VFTGDTLFPGGPGLTGWPHSDFTTIIESIRRRLLCLPSDTKVHPGHGASSTVGVERPHLQAWIDRGW